MKRRRGWMSRLGMLAGGACFALLLSEIGLRGLGVSHPMFGQADPILGGSLRPTAEGWYTREGRAYVRINADGMRDFDYGERKPANCLRIAVLGDSYAEARQVDLKSSFPKIVERILNKIQFSDAPLIEVLNFGGSGFGTDRELLTLRHKVWRYSPDIVLVAFLTGNDIADNSHEINKRQSVPYFRFDEQNKLILDTSFRNNRSWKWRRFLDSIGITRLVNKSATLQLIKHAIAVASKRSAKPIQRAEWDESGLNPEIYLEPIDPKWQRAWQLTENILKELKAEVFAHDAKLLVVTLSNGIQVHPDPNVRLDFCKTIGCDDVFYADNRIEAFCQDHEIAVLKLAPALQRYAEERQVFLHGFQNTRPGNGHWNEMGHRVAGELIAEKTAELIREVKSVKTAQFPRADRTQ